MRIITLTPKTLLFCQDVAFVYDSTDSLWVAVLSTIKTSSSSNVTRINFVNVHSVSHFLLIK